jgi:hypothetical protein
MECKLENDNAEENLVEAFMALGEEMEEEIELEEKLKGDINGGKPDNGN